MNQDIQPPRWADKLLSWFCSEKVLETLQGDLYELYGKRLSERGRFVANLCFVRDVIDACRPFAIRRSRPGHLNQVDMFQNYFKIGWRNLVHTKGYSLINIGGLALGMTVAMFIGLWIYDELSFNKYHKNYDHIGQAWGGGTNPETSEISGSIALQYPVAGVLRNNYPQHFKHVLLAWWVSQYTISVEDKKFSKTGEFIEAGAPDMLSLTMLKGTYESLNNPHSVILSRSTAESIFGDVDPMNKRLTISSINNLMDVEVTGIYEDIPRNDYFGEVQFFAPWSLWALSNDWIKGSESDWDNRPFSVLIQLQPNSTFEAANAAIKNLYYENVPSDFFKTIEKNKPFAQIIPMSTWHLYSEFENGKPAGGRIMFVWLFGIIGAFVLLLACINFINLSTARSEKRAREVGIRKAIGSSKKQLVLQFLSESFMVVILAFVFSLVLLVLMRPWFNTFADKNIALPFGLPTFWTIMVGFNVLTGFMAGLYPAFYLSSFQPAKVLKGALHVGRSAAMPRKILVVVQFSVSIVLIIGTLIIYKQVLHARNRPIGYDRQSLITLSLGDPNYKGKQDALRTELLNTGVVSDVATSSSPLTQVWNVTGGYEWPGKDPNLEAEFAQYNITQYFGKTIGWQFAAGRDFSSDFTSDSTNSVIVNEAAVKYMGLKDPVGQELVDVDEFGHPKWSRVIVGVVKDIVMESPYEPVKPTIYYFNYNAFSQLHIKINSAVSAIDALPKIKSALEKVVPTALFDYKFVDQEYARKFGQEEHVGQLSGVFSVLAIFISCLGLFGLASFVAEQRTKEIGIRKVMGASVSNLWRMLSKDFVILVIISCFIAIPVAWYLMYHWLQKYAYRTEISWWVFLVTCIGALLITLLTVSHQALKAAWMNPVNSLRSE